jgi:hypothetical protein
MSLDVGVGRGRQLSPDPNEPVLHVELPEYEFMYPWFERLHALTGTMIDLYGDARFEGQALDSLAETIAEIRHELESKPRSWENVVAEATYPNQPQRRPENIKVQRAPLAELLDRWQEIIARARETGRPVVCFGD